MVRYPESVSRIVASASCDAGNSLGEKSMNTAYRPMLATLVDKPFDDKKWIFETKWDGFRLVTENAAIR